jgi:hypothetical protein
VSSRIENEGFFVVARKSRDCAEAYIGTPPRKASPQIDAATVEKNRFRSETHSSTKTWTTLLGTLDVVQASPLSMAAAGFLPYFYAVAAAAGAAQIS